MDKNHAPYSMNLQNHVQFLNEGNSDRRQLREIASYPVYDFDNDLMNLTLKENILTPFTTSSSFRVECESFPIFCPVSIEKRQHLDVTEDEAERKQNSHQLERRMRACHCGPQSICFYIISLSIRSP